MLWVWRQFELSTGPREAWSAEGSHLEETKKHLAAWAQVATRIIIIINSSSIIITYQPTHSLIPRYYVYQ